LKFSDLICCGTAADQHGVIGWFDGPAVIGIEERQFLKPERKIYGFGFAGSRVRMNPVGHQN